MKLESSSISAAIKQSNIILENHIKTQLPSSRSKYQQELPKIVYNNNNIRGSEDLEDNNNTISENKINSEIIYNDWSLL